MKDYLLLEHTADAKFQAFGKTLDEAFANSVKALKEIITDKKPKDDRVFSFELKEEKHKKLLYDFLDKIIFIIDTEHFIPVRADVKIENNMLSATLYGDDIRNFGGNLKAVTYSDMEVKKTDKGWMLQVVVDI